MSAIPCKRPKVDFVPGTTNPGTVVAVCLVPRCGWTYPDNPQRFVAVKSDAQEQAVRHRRVHRDAVPSTKVVHDVEWDVYCEPCGGHRRTFGTRVDADAWLTYHLSTEHGLVTC